MIPYLDPCPQCGSRNVKLFEDDNLGTHILCENCRNEAVLRCSYELFYDEDYARQIIADKWNEAWKMSKFNPDQMMYIKSSQK